MNTAVETLSPTRVRITVEVPFDEVVPNLDAAYKRIGAAINVPGFRKGKIPAAIIDQRVGRGAVLEEAINDIIPEAYNDAVRSNELRVLGQPQVEVTSMSDGEPVTFTAEVDIRPEFTLPAYVGLEVSVDDAEVADTDIDEQVDRLRDRFASLNPVERAAADGDHVTLDLTSAADGESIDEASAQGLSYVVGSGDLIDGIDPALVGLAAGESATITTTLQGLPELDGKDVQVTVLVKSVRERSLPAADDDFAQLASEFDTIAELRAEVSKQAGEMKVLEQGIQARDLLVEQLLDSLDIPLPENLISAEVDEHLGGEGRESDDEHRAEVDGELRNSLKRQFLLDDIAKAENLTVNEAELSEYLVQQSMRYGMAPDQFAAELQRAGQITAVVADVLRAKALSFVLENAKVSDASGRPVELARLDSALVADSDHADDGHAGHDHD